jgi:hypothetical protein
VWRYVWGRDTYEQFAEELLSPPPRDNSSIPRRVQKRLDEALQVKRINASLYAVAIGRVLETVCSEEGMTQGGLAAKLRELANARDLPGPLLDIADELRRLRNLGAHDAEIDVVAEDVQAIEDLTESLLEYLYRGPARLAAVQAALKEREAELISQAAERRNARKQRWTREELLIQIKERRGPAEAEVAQRLFAWVDGRADLVEWYGLGKKDGSFQAGYRDGSQSFFPFALYGYGRIEVQFQYMQRAPAFTDEQPRRELLGRLNTIPGVDIGDDMLTKRPSIPLELLATAAAFERFTATLDWAFKRASDRSA